MTKLKLRLTYTLPSVDPTAPLYTLPVEIDVDRALKEGFSTGFHTMAGAGIGIALHVEDNLERDLDPDPTRVVSRSTPDPRKVHLLNMDHDCDYTLCGNLPVAGVRRRYVAGDPTSECVPCFSRAGRLTLGGGFQW